MSWLTRDYLWGMEMAVVYWKRNVLVTLEVGEELVVTMLHLRKGVVSVMHPGDPWQGIADNDQTVDDVVRRWSERPDLSDGEREMAAQFLAASPIVEQEPR